MDRNIVKRHLVSIFLLIVQIAIGTFLSYEFSTSESIVDNLYFAVVTISTIGYGDIIPEVQHYGLRVPVGIYGFIGTSVVAGELDMLMSFYIDKLESWSFEGLRETGKEIMRTFYSIMTILGLLVVGTIGGLTLEGLGFRKAIYLASISATTVGFGDISFKTPKGRIFAIIWILLSQPCLVRAFVYLRRPRKIIPFELPESSPLRQLEPEVIMARKIGVPMTFFNTRALRWTLENMTQRDDVVYIIHVLPSPPEKIEQLQRDQNQGAYPIPLTQFLDNKVYEDLGLKKEEIEDLDFEGPLGCIELATDIGASINVKVTWGYERNELKQAIAHLGITDVVMARRNCSFLQRILLRRLTSYIAEEASVSFTELKAA